MSTADPFLLWYFRLAFCGSAFGTFLLVLLSFVVDDNRGSSVYIFSALVLFNEVIYTAGASSAVLNKIITLTMGPCYEPG